MRSILGAIRVTTARLVFRQVVEHYQQSLFWKMSKASVLLVNFLTVLLFVKAHAVYLSQYQLLPYNRIEEYFCDQLGIPISAGRFNFNEQAAALVKSSGATAIKKALQYQAIITPLISW